jgi:hypothetical protein
MRDRIIESVNGRANKDAEDWYQTKVSEMACFLVRRIREDNAALKTIESVKCERLEVIVK